MKPYAALPGFEARRLGDPNCAPAHPAPLQPSSIHHVSVSQPLKPRRVRLRTSGEKQLCNFMDDTGLVEEILFDAMDQAVPSMRSD